MPKRLPGFVKLSISKVPEYMKPAAANGIFAPTAAHLANVKFRYIDNVVHEPTSMEGCVAASGVGKGYLDEVYEANIKDLRQHDMESERKLLEYARQYRKAGDSGKKPDRPTDVATLVPEPDMTNPALIQLLMDAEQEGNCSIYTLIPEIDLLDQCCGCHQKVTKVIRLNFDTKRYGAQRATVEGITGHPFMRWKFNFSCVEEKAVKFFKSGLTDGTLGRIGFSYIPKPRKKDMPRQGNYDDAYQRNLNVYLDRIRKAKGEIKVPKVGALIDGLRTELEDMAELADDDVFESLFHRSLVIAWIKGCVLYIAEGGRWTKEIADFVEWALCYDLWSKIALFTSLMKENRGKPVVDVRRYGPVNMLEKLPHSFQQQQLEAVRSDMGKPVYCVGQLSLWLDRNFITYDAEKQLYTKTETYYAKHPKK